ncbi:MAG TPA: VOC family protein [Chitinophagales bacterium]|nr:VOC family protein [Chitinophagales bacterium]
MMNQRVTGIGGVFICSADPKRLQDWYAKHLGIAASEHGVTFRWSENPKGTTAWSVFKQGTEYLKPAEDRTFMINYRVHDLHGLLYWLEKEGVEIVGKMQEESYGKFAWVLDCDGNKVELWEPVDDAL